MSLQDSTFKTARALDNEIIKASDFDFAFEQLIENVCLSTQMILESTQDFVINGKVVPDTGMNVKVSPIYGVCKSTGKPFGRTEESESVGFEGSVSGRIDIIEVRGGGVDDDGKFTYYDNQQRAFNDPDTDIQTYQYVDTKKLYQPIYQVKKGEEGAGVAPTVDTGWVKLAEVSVRAGASSILESDIHNITSDVAGMNNTDWTEELDATYNIGYISDVNERFRVQHNGDGTHKDNVIDTDSLNIGTGAKQVNGNVLPIGGNVTIPSQSGISSADSIYSVITKAVAVITTLYNNYLLYGAYGFKGELSVSSIADGNNALTKPITIVAAGDGTAIIKVDNAAVLSIDADGKLTTNGYTATGNNHIVTKAVTDAISTALSNLADRVTAAETSLATKNKYANGTLSAGTLTGKEGRYNYDTVSITVATTQNMTLSGNQNPIDGITVSNGEYILVMNQTNAKNNGIYQFINNAAWQRVNSYLSPNTLKGKIFNIQKGTVNGKKMFYLPNDTFTNPSSFGSDDINFLEYFGTILPAAYRHAMRDGNGCVKTAEPNSSDDSANKIYVDPVVSNSKTFTGPALKTNMSLKLHFTATITGTKGTALAVTYNGSSVTLKAVKNGSLQNVLPHNLSGSTWTYLHAYTTLEVIYNGSYFVIMNNPVVLSGEEYVIHADGKLEGGNIGDVKATSLNTVPYGWKECNGQSLLNADYPTLYSYFNTQNVVLEGGTTKTLKQIYGYADSTHFNVPDYREVALVGAADSTSDKYKNTTDSISDHDKYTVGQFKDDRVHAHTHDYSSPTGTSPVYVNATSVTSYYFYMNTKTFSTTSYGEGSTTRGKRKGVKFIIKVL